MLRKSKPVDALEKKMTDCGESIDKWKTTIIWPTIAEERTRIVRQTASLKLERAKAKNPSKCLRASKQHYHQPAC